MTLLPYVAAYALLALLTAALMEFVKRERMK